MRSKALNHKLILVLFVTLLLPAITTAQNDDEVEEAIVTLNLTEGEITSYELLYAGIIRLVKDGFSSYSSSNQVLGRVTFSEPGEYLLSTSYLEIKSETQGRPSSPSFSPLIIGEPTGDCRNRAFAEHDNAAIFINCPSTISFVYGASTQFATLLLWRISDQSPFLLQDNEFETEANNASASASVFDLTLATGEKMDYELLFAVPVQTEEDRLSTYSTGDRQISGSLNFAEAGEYVLFANFFAIVKKEEPTHPWNTLVMGGATGSCRNLAFEKFSTATILMSCPGSITFTVLTEAQFSSLLLWRINE